MNAVVLSSVRHDWETPQAFFDALNEEFRFTLDACATRENAKVSAFISPEENALTKPWAGRVWMNPPYGRFIGKWVKKAYEEAQTHAEVVVAFVPGRTDTSWWHDYVMRACEIRLVRGRVTFERAGSNAPFPSVVVVFRPGDYVPKLSTMDRYPVAGVPA